jgi:hypothetical protein
MKSNARSSGLRRVVFAGVLAATGAAAVLSPDWCSVLKAQGYYGSVDLSILASAPAQVKPGDEFVIGVSVRNQGPDTAHRLRTIATAPQLSYVYGSGCNGSHYPQCVLADALGIGGVEYYLVMRVPAHARNHVQFSASVASDDTEANPGDEIAVMKIPVYVPLDLRTDIACAPLATAARDDVRCSIRFVNDGQFEARLPLLRASVDAAYAPRWSCESSLPELCMMAVQAGDSYGTTLAQMPGAAVVTFFVDLRANAARPVVTLDAEARLNPIMGETDVAPQNNQRHFDYEPSIFADDFESAD